MEDTVKDEVQRLLHEDVNKIVLLPEKSEMKRCLVTSAEVQGVEQAKLLTIDAGADKEDIPLSEFDEKDDQGKDIQYEIPSSIDDRRKEETSTADTMQGRKQPKEWKPNVSLQLDIKAAHNYNEKNQRVESISQKIPIAEPSKPLKVQVFLKEGEGKLLTLEKGKLTTAGEIKTMMLEVLAIPKSAKRLFAIWLISPYLEVQLKSHHIPYILRKQWRDMLLELSSCQDQMLAANDEPVLVFQRDSFCLVKREERENDETVIKRLFAEAHYNILNAKYPIPIEDAIMLGGILARIKLGAYSPEVKTGYLKKDLTNLLPYYAIGSNKIIQQLRGSSVEQLLREQHEHSTKKMSDVLACQKKFLDYCRSLPYYGCAFFCGMVIQDHTSWKFWKSFEKDVSVGINRNGITIFTGVKQENMIHMPYDDLSWEYIKEGEADALCIEYDVVDSEGHTVPQQIQIISKQACMMDAMIDSCVNSLNAMNVPKTPTSADYSKLLDLSHSTIQSNKNTHNFSLSRPFKTR